MHDGAADLVAEFGFDRPGDGSFQPDAPPGERFGNVCTWRTYSGHTFTVAINEGKPGPGVESTVDGRRAVETVAELCAKVDKALPMVGTRRSTPAHPGGGATVLCGS